MLDLFEDLKGFTKLGLYLGSDKNNKLAMKIKESSSLTINTKVEDIFLGRDAVISGKKIYGKIIIAEFDDRKYIIAPSNVNNNPIVLYNYPHEIYTWICYDKKEKDLDEIALNVIKEIEQK